MADLANTEACMLIFLSLGGHLHTVGYMELILCCAAFSDPSISVSNESWMHIFDGSFNTTTFKLLSMPLKAFPFLAHPTITASLCANPAHLTSGKPQVSLFCNENFHSYLLGKKRVYWFCAYLLKMRHPLWPLQLHSFPPCVLYLFLIQTAMLEKLVCSWCGQSSGDVIVDSVQSLTLESPED